MTKNIHTATAPDGTTLKRTSANRIYTHVTIGRANYATDFAQADKISDQDRRNYDYDVTRANGTHEHVQPTAWRNAEKCAEDIAKAAAQIAPYPDRDDYAQAMRIERLERLAAEVKAGRYEAWLDLGWSGNLSLAQKNANAMAAHYVDVRILPATVVSK